MAIEQSINKDDFFNVIIKGFQFGIYSFKFFYKLYCL